MYDEINLLYSYVLKWDTGFAPNPFSGVCTLACCKPKIRKGVAKYVISTFKNEKIGVPYKEKNKKNRVYWGKAIDGFNAIGERWNENNPLEAIKNVDPNYIKKQKIWVVGLTGKTMFNKPKKVSGGEIVYAMQVTDIVSFPEYSKDYNEKKPCSKHFTTLRTDNKDLWAQNMSSKNCGDNIYEFDSEAKCIRQLPSFHQENNQLDENTLAHDLSGEYILLSDNFVYLGNNCKETALCLHEGRNHTKLSRDYKREELYKAQFSILDSLKSFSDSGNLYFGKNKNGFIRPIHSHKDFAREV